MRRFEVGPDAAPARGRRTLLPYPGGAGAPPGTTTSPCEELADGAAPELAPPAKRGPAPEGERRRGAT